MISKVELGSVNSNYKQPRPSFGKSNGILHKVGDGLLDVMQTCEKKPMINVMVLDLVTAILPRTFMETFLGSKQKNEDGETQRRLNLLGGFEAFRRESSGLLINCMIPGFIVMGVSKLLNKPMMQSFSKSGLATSWSNSDTYELVKKYYDKSIEDANVSPKDVVKNTLTKLLNDISGVDGSQTKDFSTLLNDDETNKLIDDISQKIVDKNVTKKDKANFYDAIVKKTKIAENIKIKDSDKFLSSNLNHLSDSTIEILEGISKEDLLGKGVEEYLKKAKKLVTAKSIGGLALVLSLALSAQPINRWITHKISGREGAPIYNDDINRVLSDEDKAKLNKEKAVALPIMCGVTALSMFMDRPSLRMFQFKNTFPTMDQARVIATSTFASRLLSSEDSNELKESTIRDIATFSSFYFLGDYVAKGVATFLEKKKGVSLLNRLKPDNKDANVFQKAWDWAKHTKIKSSDELLGNDKAIKMRGWCQFFNIAFSLFSLGVLIPLYTRSQTKKKQKQMEELAKINSTNQVIKDKNLDLQAVGK